MTRLKQSLIAVSGFLTLTLLGGCLTGDDPKSSSSFAIETEAEVTDIETPDTDLGVPGVLSTTQTNYSCVDGEVDEDEVDENYNYAITGGFLYLWQGTSCTAMKFSGTSSSIKGTWTSSDLSARIPSKYRSAICDTATLDDNEYEAFLNDAVITYTITSSKITGSIKGSFCYAEAVTEQFKDYEDVTIVSSDCSTVKMRNDDLETTATVTVTYKDDKITQAISYNGKNCKVSIPVYLSSKEPTCSEEADEAYQEEYEAFNDCIEESEFYDDFNSGSAPKASAALRTSFEKALKRARPF